MDIVRKFKSSILCNYRHELSFVVKKTGLRGFRAVQPQKMAGGLNFGLRKYYPCSENKGFDQLRGYREADLRLCFRIYMYGKGQLYHKEAQFWTDFSLKINFKPYGLSEKCFFNTFKNAKKNVP